MGAGVGGAGAGARGGGHLGISGTLGGVSILAPEPLCREKLWGQKQELYQWMYVRWVGPRGRGYLVGVPGQPVPVVHHAAPPPASAPPAAARHRRRRSLGFNRLENIFELDKPCSELVVVTWWMQDLLSRQVESGSEQSRLPVMRAVLCFSSS